MDMFIVTQKGFPQITKGLKRGTTGSAAGPVVPALYSNEGELLGAYETEERVKEIALDIARHTCVWHIESMNGDTRDEPYIHYMPEA